MTANGLAALIKNAVPDTGNLKGGVCFKLCCQHFVEGIQVERTPYKNIYHIWSFISPTWSQLNTPSLNYAVRIMKCNVGEHSDARTLEDVLAAIRGSEDYKLKLIGPETKPAKFLRDHFAAFSWQTTNMVTKLYDFAMASILAGELSVGSSCLERLLGMIKNREDAVAENASNVISSLGYRDRRHLELIFEMENKGMVKMNILNSL